MNSNAAWLIRVRGEVYKNLAKFPTKNRDRLVRTIASLTLNPMAGDIEKMRGEENTWRRRIGAYRIFYEIIVSEKVVYVFRVERRGSKTY